MCWKGNAYTDKTKAVVVVPVVWIVPVAIGNTAVVIVVIPRTAAKNSLLSNLRLYFGKLRLQKMVRPKIH